ncbi:MAG: FAD-dependent oxidoreductase [Anaerolineae bacterium]
MHDVIVVGGGIVGVAAAYYLTRGGADTLLIDRPAAGRATDAGAGIISPQTNSRDPGPWFDLASAAAADYPSLIQNLADGGAGDTGFARVGLLLVAMDAQDAVAYDEASARIFARQRARGEPSGDDLREVTSDEAQRLFPLLAPVTRALYHRQAARLDGRLLAQALRRAAQEAGLNVQAAAVEGLAIRGRDVGGVVVDGQPIVARNVVIAGGAWSAAFGEALDISIPVAPQRGQIMHLGLPTADTTGWPVVNSFRGHYMVPWPNRMVAGATRETGAGFAPHVTAGGVAEVLREAMRVAPGLAGATVLETRVGLRPLSADGLAVLGAVPGVGGVYLATGHGPTGLTLGPFSGKLVAQMILGQPLSADITPFSVSRFS